MLSQELRERRRQLDGQPRVGAQPGAQGLRDGDAHVGRRGEHTGDGFGEHLARAGERRWVASLGDPRTAVHHPHCAEPWRECGQDCRPPGAGGAFQHQNPWQPVRRHRSQLLGQRCQLALHSCREHRVAPCQREVLQRQGRRATHTGLAELVSAASQVVREPDHRPIPAGTALGCSQHLANALRDTMAGAGEQPADHGAERDEIVCRPSAATIGPGRPNHGFPTRQYHRAERQATVTEAVHVELRQTGGEIDGDLQNVEHRHVGGGELTERRSRRQARHMGA